MGLEQVLNVVSLSHLQVEGRHASKVNQQTKQGVQVFAVGGGNSKGGWREWAGVIWKSTSEPPAEEWHD